jgi:hypothetical protein
VECTRSPLSPGSGDVLAMQQGRRSIGGSTASGHVHHRRGFYDRTAFRSERINSLRSYVHRMQSFAEVSGFRSFYDENRDFSGLIERVENMKVDRRGFLQFRTYNAFLMDLYANREPRTTLADLYPQIIELDPDDPEEVLGSVCMDLAVDDVSLRRQEVRVCGRPRDQGVLACSRPEE